MSIWTKGAALTGCRAIAALAAMLFLPITTAGIALAAAPGDLVLPRTSDETPTEAIPASISPHWIHRINYRCDACHNRLFEMELGATEMSMEALQKGKLCGTCHNGQKAFEIGFTTCNRCHVTPE